MAKYNKYSSGRKKKAYKALDFPDMAKRINAYLKEEGLNLSFQGYKNTILSYLRLQEHDLYTIYQLMTECNLWSNYFSEVENFIQIKYLEYETETDRLLAFFNKKFPEESLEEAIKQNQYKTRDFKVFYNQLVSQRKLFEKAYWHCYKLYGKGNHTLNYKSIN